MATKTKINLTGGVKDTTEGPVRYPFYVELGAHKNDPVIKANLKLRAMMYTTGNPSDEYLTKIKHRLAELKAVGK